ncbi:MAG: hypothetical protein QXR42_08475 [Candidatus Bathyarchaeia archaeon]
MPFGKWENLDACVKDFMAHVETDEKAKQICVFLKDRPEKEAEQR